MKMNKRGAIEFSMTTVIIIIIGVAILALALPWVARTLGQASDLTDSAFSAAKEQLSGQVNPSNPLVIYPADVYLSIGDQEVVTVAYYNSAGGSSSLTVSPGTKFQVTKSDNPSGSQPAGSTLYWKLIVENTGTAAGQIELRTLSVGSEAKPLTIIAE